ncbi:NAD(+) diphosphatase [Gottschalkiaceae bacterium SANA]|nr:NAD(+) diphosphatase [Gottschalkiaceae bacterium SANA]
MYQEGLSEQINIEYQDAKISINDKVLLFDNKGNSILRSQDDECFFIYKDLQNEGVEWGDQDFYYLFSIENEKYFVLIGQLPEGFSERFLTCSRSEIFSNRSDKFSYITLTASHIYDWYKKTKFCGACGEPMEARTDERAKTCKHCGNRIYPQISPVVIVAVSNANELLLTKYANRAHKRYALVAGFVEVGETLEAAVKREVMEETGVRVKNIKYFDSQPWGITGGLLSGFFADLDGDSTLTVDYEELHEARWMPAKDVQEMELNTKSLTGTLIEVWREKITFSETRK